MGVINNVEFRIVSLARSGHHGIINWIIGQCHGKVCYLNGVKPNRNPYLAYGDKDLKNITEEEFLSGRKKPNRTLKKDYLLYSYEELPLQDVCTDNFRRNHDKYLGRSLKKIDILVLRDPYNYFASRLKLEGLGLYNPNIPVKLTNKKSREALTDLWLQYAREYLGESNNLKNNKVVINFNKWVSDKSYRKELAMRLGLKFSDRSMNKLTKSGPGSSFDKLKYANDAGKMKVLERWEVLKDYPFYREIFENKEIVELSNKIFGKIPGTDILFKKQKISRKILYNARFNLLILKGKLTFLIKKMIYPIKDAQLIKFLKKRYSFS